LSSLVLGTQLPKGNWLTAVLICEDIYLRTRMYETIVLGVISSTISDISLEKVRSIRSQLSDHPEVLGDINTEFEKSLQTEIDSRLSHDIDITGVLDELKTRDSDPAQSTLFEDRRSAIDEITGVILTASISNEEPSEEIKQEVRQATEQALDDASTVFIKEVHEAGLASKVGLEANIEILRRLNHLSNEIAGANRYSRGNDHYLIHDCRYESFTTSHLQTVNIRDHNPPEFVNRNEVRKVSGDDDVVIIGKKGTGKTRSLLEIISDKVEEGRIDQVVEFRDSFVEEDVSDLLREDLAGTTLFVCDDIHRHHMTAETHPLSLAISRVETELEGDSNVINLLSLRSERLDSVPRLFRESDHPWDRFSKVHLRSLEVDQVESVVESCFDERGFDVDEQIVDQLVSKITRTDPTPHYAVSAVDQLIEGGEISESGIHDLATDAEGIWARQYRTLRQQSDAARRILLSIKLLREHVIYPTISTTQDVFENALEGDPLNFEPATARLLKTQWIGLGIPEEEVDGFFFITHGAQLDAIEEVPESVVDRFRERVIEWDEDTFNLNRESAARVQVRIVQGIRYSQNPDFPQIEPHLERALELAPKSMFVQNMCGVVYGEFGYREKGQEHLEKALEIDSSNPQVNYNLARFLPSRRNIDRTLEHYKRANEEFTGNARVLHGLGMALVGSGDLEEGLEKYDEALEAGGEFGELYFARGDTLNLLERYEEAQKELSKALEYFENHEQWLRLAKSNLIMAIAKFNSDDLEGSVRSAEEGLSLIKRIEDDDLEINPVTDDPRTKVSSIKSELIIISSRAVLEQEP